MFNSFMETVNEGDAVRLRSGKVCKVEFIAYMPDDLISNYDYVVRLSGSEPATYTNDGKWYEDEDTESDIVEVQEKAS
ncbi:hypothetical protein [Acinetobacter radioresistens]|uniref:hypothetical protein n=1 Tax=Acinetobacter radioresistens TaxID=40216 RepID=UPI00028D96C1|nr:hypothetical protein [Acinetobacter radioresistens]EKU3442084.1 hypothetical protein [Acinetobacter baumannii]BBL22266.1 hypothetical protein ACRAD_29370 [Acinetobacter radioresistens DSM 6976 = NBRC 102413 = CIP 103788]